MLAWVRKKIFSRLYSFILMLFRKGKMRISEFISLLVSLQMFLIC